jgi:hypothetical protein
MSHRDHDPQVLFSGDLSIVLLAVTDPPSKQGASKPNVGWFDEAPPPPITQHLLCRKGPCRAQWSGPKFDIRPPGQQYWRYKSKKTNSLIIYTDISPQ